MAPLRKPTCGKNQVKRAPQEIQTLPHRPDWKGVFSTQLCKCVICYSSGRKWTTNRVRLLRICTSSFHLQPLAAYLKRNHRLMKMKCRHSTPRINKTPICVTEINSGEWKMEQRVRKDHFFGTSQPLVGSSVRAAALKVTCVPLAFHWMYLDKIIFRSLYDPC